MEENRTTGLGEAGVHSQVGLHPQPSKGDGMSGKFDAGSSQGGGSTVDTARDRAGEMAGQARERMSDMADQARGRMDDVRGRAGDMMGQARDRASTLLDQAADSEPVRMARDNPLPALGIAFAAGFLLAGSSDTGGRFGKAKQQIRGAVMGGISAALAQELRGVLGGEGGASDLLNSLMGNQGGGSSSQGSRSRA